MSTNFPVEQKLASIRHLALIKYIYDKLKNDFLFKNSLTMQTSSNKVSKSL